MTCCTGFEVDTVHLVINHAKRLKDLKNVCELSDNRYEGPGEDIITPSEDEGEGYGCLDTFPEAERPQDPQWWPPPRQPGRTPKTVPIPPPPPWRWQGSYPVQPIP